MEEIIIRWKLNRPLLASKMGMPLGTFNNKLSPKHSSKFSKDESLRLRVVMIELMNEIDGATNIEFEDAIKIILTTKKD